MTRSEAQAILFEALKATRDFARTVGNGSDEAMRDIACNLPGDLADYHKVIAGLERAERVWRVLAHMKGQKDGN